MVETSRVSKVGGGFFSISSRVGGPYAATFRCRVIVFSIFTVWGRIHGETMPFFLWEIDFVFPHKDLVLLGHACMNMLSLRIRASHTFIFGIDQIHVPNAFTERQFCVTSCENLLFFF